MPLPDIIILSILAIAVIYSAIVLGSYSKIEPDDDTI
jgi:hypothetical protein